VQESGLGELQKRLRELTSMLTSNEAPTAFSVRSELSAV